MILSFFQNQYNLRNSYTYPSLTLRLKWSLGILWTISSLFWPRGNVPPEDFTNMIQLSPYLQVISPLLRINVSCPSKINVSLQWFLVFVDQTWFLQPQLNRHHKFLIQCITQATLIESLSTIQASLWTFSSQTSIIFPDLNKLQQKNSLGSEYSTTFAAWNFKCHCNPPKNKWPSLSQRYNFEPGSSLLVCFIF